MDEALPPVREAGGEGGEGYGGRSLTPGSGHSFHAAVSVYARMHCQRTVRVRETGPGSKKRECEQRGRETSGSACEVAPGFRLRCPPCECVWVIYEETGRTSSQLGVLALPDPNPWSTAAAAATAGKGQHRLHSKHVAGVHLAQERGSSEILGSLVIYTRLMANARLKTRSKET